MMESMEMNMNLRCVISDLTEESRKLREALKSIEGWDVKGESLRDAYDCVNGDGSWADLIGD